MLAAWCVLGGVGVIAVVTWRIWRPMRAATRVARLSQARRDFHWQRERLEAKFVHLAATNAKPRSPHWDLCDFDDDVAYVRNRNTGELSAFVAVTIAMGGPDLPDYKIGGLTSNLRAGTAVFRFDGHHWETEGRAILNLSPTEAIRFYGNDLEIVDHELVGRP